MSPQLESADDGPEKKKCKLYYSASERSVREIKKKYNQNIGFYLAFCNANTHKKEGPQTQGGGGQTDR